MPTIEDLRVALANTEKLIGGVRDDQWSEPTPCTEWDVRALVDHTTWVALAFAARAEGRELAPTGRDVLGDVPVRAFTEAAASALTAWGRRGTAGTMRLPIGELPAEAALGIQTLDTYIHAWDLARATGQDAVFDGSLADGLLAFMLRVLPEPPRDGRFAPSVATPADAPAQDRLVAHAGRTP
jgi:uncharacterized protein (TIGR03086 family)